MKCVVLLGKYGDLINLAPAFQAMKARDGSPPIVMVSEAFGSVLDGLSYVIPWKVPLDWKADVTRASIEAGHHYEAIVPQEWLLSGVDVFPVNEQDIPTCQHLMWHRLGFNEQQMMSLEVEFDQRDLGREKQLASRVANWKKPVVLINLEGESCPFGFAPEVIQVLQPLRHLVDFVDLARVKADKIYDLLGLYERAAALITVDTATLHLAGVGTIPYVALVNDGWSRAVPKGQCVLELSYSQVLSRIWEIPEIVQHLARIKGSQKTATHYDCDNPPSVLHQQPSYAVRLIDELPGAGVEYLNCGLLEHKGRRFLVPRRCASKPGFSFGFNSVVAFEMSGRRIIGPEIPITLISVAPDEHFEDPRIVSFEGRIFLSCCNFVWGTMWSGSHQVLFELTEHFEAFKRWDILYGKNGNWIDRNTGMEKNWLFFFHEGRPHMVYTTEPMEVVEMDWNFNAVKTHRTTSHLNWPWGEPRGGTPPILMGGEYWTFFHSSHRWHETGTARYHMGFMAFEARPPFRKTRFIKLPILSGSSQDRWAHSKPVTVFPCGATYQPNGTWLVTFGINDLYCGLAEIPHSDLLKEMVEI